MLRVMLSQESLGRAMARLYEHHILHEAVMRDAGAPARNSTPLQRMSERRQVHGALQLSNLRIRPKGASLDGGIDAYNQTQELAGGSCVTSILLNATTLNSGSRFFFSGVELGDFNLGQFRRDEFDALKERRRLLLDVDVKQLETMVSADAASAITDPDGAAQLRMRSLALWWRRIVAGVAAPVPDGWEKLFTHPAATPWPGELLTCATGLLRQAKVPAWYLRYGYDITPTPVTGGQTREQHWLRVCSVLTDIDRELAANIHAGLDPNEDAARLLLEFIVELYLLRTSERMSPTFDKDWQDISIADAVGASACFPPVFPPFVFLGIYDDAHITRLGLSDGGAYDNVGITGLMDEDCTAMIASDTAGLFDQLRSSPVGHLGMIMRLPNILMNALGGFQRLVLRDQKRTSDEFARISDKLPATVDNKDAAALVEHARAGHNLHELAYFNMAAPPPPLPADMAPPITTGIDRQTLASIRTDLDCFGEIEIAALVNDGYDTADRFARGFLTRYAKPEWKTVAPQAPRDLVQGAHVQKVLQAGSARVVRALMVRAPVSVFAFVLAGLALMGASFMLVRPINLWHGLSAMARGFVAGFAHALTNVLGPVGNAIVWASDFVPHYGPIAIDRVVHAPLAVLLLGALLIAWALKMGRPPHAATRRAKYVWLQTLNKWARSLLGNVLWLVWALPLFIVIAITIVTSIGWVFLYWPWRARARIRRPHDVRAKAERAVALPRAEPVSVA